MEKELVKKILKTTNFTTTEIYKLIDLYKETTSVTASNFKNCVLFFCGKEKMLLLWLCPPCIDFLVNFLKKVYFCSKLKAVVVQINGKTTMDRKNFRNFLHDKFGLTDDIILDRYLHEFSTFCARR